MVSGFDVHPKLTFPPLDSPPFPFYPRSSLPERKMVPVKWYGVMTIEYRNATSPLPPSGVASPRKRIFARLPDQMFFQEMDILFLRFDPLFCPLFFFSFFFPFHVPSGPYSPSLLSAGRVGSAPTIVHPLPPLISFYLLASYCSHPPSFFLLSRQRAEEGTANK